MVVETVGTVLALGIAGGIAISILGVARFKNPWLSVVGLIILLTTIVVASVIAPITYEPIGGPVAVVLALLLGSGIAVAVLGVFRFGNPYVVMLGLIMLIVAITVTLNLAAV